MGIQETHAGGAILKSDLAILVKLMYVCYILTWAQHGTHIEDIYWGVFLWKEFGHRDRLMW